MTLPIPNRIIRLVFRELIYLKFQESNEFQPIGIAYKNATRGCAFGREMIDYTIKQLINLKFLESNNVGLNMLDSQYRFSQKAKELIESGDFETTFRDIITTRYFIFKRNDEFGLSDIYQRKESE
ncbi:MAG TPA: hypothetical protein VK169_13480 [Saprospiraceae bacterium]|nr:hypothetical protein [Saprospiraceae bacterium]